MGPCWIGAQREGLEFCSEPGTWWSTWLCFVRRHTFSGASPPCRKQPALVCLQCWEAHSLRALLWKPACALLLPQLLQRVEG